MTKNDRYLLFSFLASNKFIALDSDLDTIESLACPKVYPHKIGEEINVCCNEERENFIEIMVELMEVERKRLILWCDYYAWDKINGWRYIKLPINNKL